MTLQMAYQILGITKEVTEKELKKIYRKLMHQVHPDTTAFHETTFRYTAQEINEAYAYICEHGTENIDKKREFGKETTYGYTYEEKKSESYMKWNAPINGKAFAKRKIYHYAEDADGEVMGDFVIAKGKYVWHEEEDFPLFIKSIFNCSKEILDEIDDEMDQSIASLYRQKIQAKLAYLLAQQFVDATYTLQWLLSSDTDVYAVPSMLEVSKGAPFVRAGMVLYPARIRQHRLYLKTKAGQEVGYVSFKDDRLYYILIPLLEQRRAQVKIRIAQAQDKDNTKGNRKYKNLDFWIRMIEKDEGMFPENINLQIEALLNSYRENA